MTADSGELVTTTVTGSVGDGPITNGHVIIENSNGQVLATQRSDEQANYQIQLKSDRNEFPLLVRVDDGIDIVTGTRLPSNSFPRSCDPKASGSST